MKRFVIFALLLFPFISNAQDYPLTDSLKRELSNANSPAQKVRVLGDLYSFYLGLDEKLSEEYDKKLTEIAEVSRDRKLMLEALLIHADAHYNHGGVQQNLNEGIRYSQQALELSQANQLDGYTAWSYLYLARGARQSGKNDEALNYSNLGLSLASSTDNDSLKISALNGLGETYFARKEKLLAFRNYIQALNAAEPTHNYTLIKNCYVNLSELYLSLEDFEKAKDFLFKLVALSKEQWQPYDRLEFYSSIGDVYAGSKKLDQAIDYYEKTAALADTLRFSIYKVNCYGRIISLYLNNNQGEKALKYFKEKKELSDFLKSRGLEYYNDHAYGLAYWQAGKYDSAEYYFKLAQPSFETKASQINQYFLYTNFAYLYQDQGQPKKALPYWLKAKSIAEGRNNLELLQNVSSNLDSVYQMMGDYKNALYFNHQYHHYKDTLEQLSTEKDLLRLEVDNENKRKEKEAQLAEEQKRERHNIQYMGITAGIAAVFIVLVMMGAFHVSKTTIRILGFFAFIFLFEFIILLADNQIHHWTHGEPWKILAIKIGLIAILLPLHHYMEEKVIHYLTSRKMFEVSPKGLLSKLSRKEQAVGE